MAGLLVKIQALRVKNWGFSKSIKSLGFGYLLISFGKKGSESKEERGSSLHPGQVPSEARIFRRLSVPGEKFL